MRRADRLFTIVQYLRGGRHVTARTLAERLEVSERTIYRDVDELTLCGVRSPNGRTGYAAAIDMLRRSGAVGASLQLAVDGRLEGIRRHARFFARNAAVPLMLIAPSVIMRSLIQGPPTSATGPTLMST